MSTLREALEIPDDEPRQWRGPRLALGGAFVAAVIGLVVARTFAFGGTTRPVLLVGLVTALPAVIVGWLGAGAHPQRTWLATAAMVLGLAAMPVASAGATPSPARLRAIADGLHFPGKVVRDVSLGNGRCRDACSELRRTTVVSDISFAKVRSQILATLKGRSYKVEEYPQAPGAPLRIDAGKGKVLVSLELRFVDAAHTRIASVFIADGPEPSHEVG